MIKETTDRTYFDDKVNQMNRNLDAVDTILIKLFKEADQIKNSVNNRKMTPYTEIAIDHMTERARRALVVLNDEYNLI